MKRKTIVALVTLFLLVWPLGQIAAAPPTGKLEIPDHHAGVLGDNEISVKATNLQIGTTYRITMRVSYHQNPRTSPDSGATPPASYVERFDFEATEDQLLKTFIVPLPGCHWQITAGFTLYYWTGKNWGWNGEATPSVDIWADCKIPPPPSPSSGTGTPRSYSTVGAISMMLAFST